MAHIVDSRDIIKGHTYKNDIHLTSYVNTVEWKSPSSILKKYILTCAGTTIRSRSEDPRIRLSGTLST